MKNIGKSVNESVKVGGNYVRRTVNMLLGEDVKQGQTVAVVDDPISGFTGAKGKVSSISDANPGFADVELENGTKVKMQTSLLVPV